MDRIKVESSNVVSVGYLQGVLEVEFKNKIIYQYNNVPENIFILILKADSKGSFLKSHVQNRFWSIKIR